MQPTTIILFGGTGDLTKRKLLPAFATLLREKKLIPGSLLIGIGRRPLTHEVYRQSLITDLSAEYQIFLKDLQILYFQDDVGQQESLMKLPAFLKAHEQEASNRLFYLATSYKLFPQIIQTLHKYTLDKQPSGWTRIVFEKPFGHDLVSSAFLDKAIHKIFPEEQIFLIDHYLAKAAILDLKSLKLGNPQFDVLLHRDLVSQIEIIVDESLGVGDRLGYYAEAGALKDMIQNHLLQMTALLLMKKPTKLTDATFHDVKTAVLEHLQVASPDRHLLGQYKSYRDECVAAKIPYTTIETFAKILLTCTLPRWKDVPIMLRTGKKLSKKYGQIIVHFKQGLTQNYQGQTLAGQQLIISLYPKQDIRLGKILLSSKQQVSTNEYATLLSDVLRGEHMLFTRFDEVEAAWKIIEQLEQIKSKIPFVLYKDGTYPEKTT